MRGLDQDRLVELVQVVVRNPLRALLSSLGVGWGLFMIIITVGAARGLENGVKADMGSDVSETYAIHQAVKYILTTPCAAVVHYDNQVRGRQLLAKPSSPVARCH